MKNKAYVEWILNHVKCAKLREVVNGYGIVETKYGLYVDIPVYHIDIKGYFDYNEAVKAAREA